MEGNKLEISGGKLESVDPPSLAATYKQIPENDMADQVEVPLSRPKSLLKSDSNEFDGADEKMLPDAEKKISPVSNVNIAEVKFTNNEKQNGDAKLDIGDIKSAFVGMDKEELMKYANDPFWVRLRWFLFIAFWLLWAGMLVGAIMIIIAAPKCTPPEPKTWWEEGPLTEINDINLDASALKQLKDRGMKAIIIPYPEDTYAALNTSDTFVSFLKLAKDADVKVIVELIPGMSTEFYSDSEDGVDEFKDYYITKKSMGGEAVPNNWLSTTSKDDNKTSAWKYSSKSKQFYLYLQDIKPQLNMRLPKVVNEFTKVLTNFLEAGVDGFRLKYIPNLLVDPTLADAILNSKASNISMHNYNFYTHSKTENLPDIGPILKQWKDLVKNKTEHGLLMLNEDLTSIDAYKVNGSFVIDLPRYSRAFAKDKQITASSLKHDLDAAYKELGAGSWPLWKNENEDLPEGVLDTVLYLLKGSVIYNSNRSIDAELFEVRKSPSIMFGSDQRYEVANKTIFAYVRVHSGNPGYVVAINPTDERIVVDFPKEIPRVSEEVTMQYFTKGYNETDIDMRLKIKSNEVPISPKSAIVLSYVPKSK